MKRKNISADVKANRNRKTITNEKNWWLYFTSFYKKSLCIFCLRFGWYSIQFYKWGGGGKGVQIKSVNGEPSKLIVQLKMSTLEIWTPTTPLLTSTSSTKKLFKNRQKQHENMKSFNKRQLFISYEALYTSNHANVKIADLKLWNTMRDFITFFTKYKTY